MIAWLNLQSRCELETQRVRLGDSLEREVEILERTG
jgi:hypothetical protein